MINVSVIIPVYNVEKYLRECIESVTNQTLKDIEIICIDDGSTDSSLEILREYAAQDKRIKILTQNNMGAAIARNKGLDLALGEYIYFLDSDDYLLPKALESIYQKITDTDSDICIFKNYRLREQTEIMENCHWEKCIKNIPSKNVFNKFDVPETLFQTCNLTAWTKLYKRSFIISNHIRFQNVKSCNDVLFNFISLACASSITFLDEMLIVHRIEHNECITKTRYKTIGSIILAICASKQELINRGYFSLLKTSFYNRANSCFEIELSHLMTKKSKKTWAKKLYKYLPKQYWLKYRQKQIKEKMQTIFSTKNNKQHKVICLLGIKIKIYLKRLEECENNKITKKDEILCQK